MKMQHESGSVIEVADKDARGLRIARESGFEWVELDGEWLQIKVAERKLRLAESVR